MALKQTVRKSFFFVFAVLASVVLTYSSVSAATIDELRAKTRQIEAQISANEAKINDLSSQITTLQGKVAQLNAEIDQANAEIELTEVKLAELEKRLKQAEEELERQKGLLKASLRALYSRRDASTVELLVASDSFSDFINEQEYLSRLQSAVKDSADRVIELKQQIQEEQVEQERLLQRQQQQKNVLAGKRQEQQDILTKTQGEEARYKTIVNAQFAALEEAEEQLAAQIAAQLAAGALTSLGPVSRGQAVGRLGSTGFSTGPHLHFQLYSGGSTINPYSGSGIINGYGWPLAGGAGYVSQSYGCVAPAGYYYTSCNGGRNSFHNGLDIAASAYTPVVAVADGQIVFRGCRGGLGYVVIVDHGNGQQSWYPHMTTPGGQVYGYC